MKIALNRFSPARYFSSRDKLEAYVRKQIEKWEEYARDQHLGSRNDINRLNDAWRSIIQGLESHEFDRSKIQNILNVHSPIVFDSELGRFIRSVVKEGRNFETLISTVQRKGSNLNNINIHQFSDAIEGVIAAQIDFRIAKYAVENWADDHSSDLEDRFGELWREQESRFIKQERDFGEIKDGIYTVLMRQIRRNRRYRGLARKGRDKAHEAFRELNAEAERLHDHYTEQLKFRRAVELWDKRSEDHRSGYRSSQSAVYGVGGIGGIFLIIWLVGGVALSNYIFPSDQVDQTVFFVSATALLGTLFIWLMRILVRNMMSMRHLSEDAAARSALAETYLALTEEEAASEQDRAIVLAALFAPVNDGLVKDDAMPAFSPSALMAQAVSGRN